tara:strand:+ start:1031 stop:1525 length:495 start_codon:yes stop_codon:yes gene_type:complete
MKPRFESVSTEVNEMLVKANKIKDRIAKLEKAQPGFSPEKIDNVNPHMVTETGGQTRTAHYHTNGKTIEVNDAKTRKKDAKEVNIESLAGRMNPHAGTGVDREDAAGEAKPLNLSKANPSAQHREALESGVGGQCATCGGAYETGCGQHAGMDINACPEYRPIL